MKRMKFGLAGLLCLLMTGCTSQAALTNQTFVYELGRDVYANPSLYIKNPEKYDTAAMEIKALSPGVAKTSNRFLIANQEYLSVGEYEFELINGSQVIPFVIKVKDTLAPNASKNPDSIEISVGDSVNWQEVYGAEDLSGVSYDAPADLSSTAGEKDISVILKDRFGNAIEKKLHVVVKP